MPPAKAAAKPIWATWAGVVLNAALPIFALILAGFLSGHTALFGPAAADSLNRLDAGLGRAQGAPEPEQEGGREGRRDAAREGRREADPAGRGHRHPVHRLRAVPVRDRGDRARPAEGGGLDADEGAGRGRAPEERGEALDRPGHRRPGEADREPSSSSSWCCSRR
jgi:hypothetical protein